MPTGFVRFAIAKNLYYWLGKREKTDENHASIIINRQQDKNTIIKYLYHI